MSAPVAAAHHRGITSDAGLYFIELPWQWTWAPHATPLGHDAEHMVEAIRRRSPPTPSPAGG